jgi:hypothetical protein
MFSNTWAHTQKEPKIFTINGDLRVYQNAADDIVRRVEKDGIAVKRNGSDIEIPGDNKLLNEITALVKQAKAKENQGIVAMFNADDTMSICFDNKKNLIFSAQLPK